jgi:hypothetical protein
MRKLTTLVCAFAVLAFSAGATAQNDEAVDWDEAIEFAEVTDTYVENNVEWVTYYDELQGAMWSQPADASPEAMKAYFTGDKETLKDLGLDWICAINWPVPNQMTINDGHGTTTTFYNADFSLDSSNTTTRWWITNMPSAWYDVDGSVAGSVRNAVSYCDDYQNRVVNQGGTGLVYDSDTCGTFYGTTYYSVSDSSHVENWDYDDSEQNVTRHRFYACESNRYVYLMLGIQPE